MGCQYKVAIYTNFPWATLPNDWLIISIIRMIGVQMIYNDFDYETGFPEPTMISKQQAMVSQTNTTNFLSTNTTPELSNRSEQRFNGFLNQHN